MNAFILLDSTVGVDTLLLSLISFLVAVLIILIKTIYSSIMKKINEFVYELKRLSEDNIHNKKDIEALKEKNFNFDRRISTLEDKK